MAARNESSHSRGKRDSMSRPSSSFGPYISSPSAAGFAASIRRSSPNVTIASLPVERTEFVKGSLRTELIVRVSVLAVLRGIGIVEGNCPADSTIHARCHLEIRNKSSEGMSGKSTYSRVVRFLFLSVWSRTITVGYQNTFGDWLNSRKTTSLGVDDLGTCPSAVAVLRNSIRFTTSPRPGSSQ